MQVRNMEAKERLKQLLLTSAQQTRELQDKYQKNALYRQLNNRQLQDRQEYLNHKQLELMHEQQFLNQEIMMHQDQIRQQHEMQFMIEQDMANSKSEKLN